ncbi:MAG: AIR synthase related protein [Thermoplasmatota archaeon]
MPKLSRELLEKILFSRDIEDEQVVLGPKYGEDAAVIDLDEGYLVMHMDPISGAVKEVGKLAVIVASNDIAVSGAEPRWCMASIQVQDSVEESDIETILSDFLDSASDMDISVIGGHTETVEGIDRPLITTCMFGLADEPVYTSGSEPGDMIVQIGPGAVEGTWILANDHEKSLMEKGVHEETIKRASGWIEDISVVEKALAVRDKVTSMHDPTEGGMIQGLYEMASASGNDFVIDREIEYREETLEICGKLDIDPLRLISSGCVVATVPEGTDISVGDIIGRVEEGEGYLRYHGETIEETTEDELFRMIDHL